MIDSKAHLSSGKNPNQLGERVVDADFKWIMSESIRLEPGATINTGIVEESPAMFE